LSGIAGRLDEGESAMPSNMSGIAGRLDEGESAMPN
jgi:hypothetical protein